MLQLRNSRTPRTFVPKPSRCKPHTRCWSWFRRTSSWRPRWWICSTRWICWRWWTTSCYLLQVSERSSQPVDKAFSITVTDLCRCGGPNHFARDCQAQAMKCYACGKIFHDNSCFSRTDNLQASLDISPAIVLHQMVDHSTLPEKPATNAVTLDTSPVIALKRVSMVIWVLETALDLWLLLHLLHRF